MASSCATKGSLQEAGRVISVPTPCCLHPAGRRTASAEGGNLDPAQPQGSQLSSVQVDKHQGTEQGPGFWVPLWPPPQVHQPRPAWMPEAKDSPCPVPLLLVSPSPGTSRLPRQGAPGSPHPDPARGPGSSAQQTTASSGHRGPEQHQGILVSPARAQGASALSSVGSRWGRQKGTPTPRGHKAWHHCSRPPRETPSGLKSPAGQSGTAPAAAQEMPQSSQDWGRSQHIREGKADSAERWHRATSPPAASCCGRGERWRGKLG